MSIFETLDEHQQDLMVRHLNLVIQANETTNLTRITSPEEAMTLHVEDSLSGLPEMNEAPEGLYGDMGSGAGYPGIPLAIATGRETLLIDSRQKKMKILDSILQELGIDNQVKTFSGRAELLARTQAGSFSVLTARALSQLSILLELASPLLKKRGQLICYKSHVSEEELNHALEVQTTVGMSLCSDRSFNIGETERRILVFEKAAKPKLNLPRLEGQAQKNPL